MIKQYLMIIEVASDVMVYEMRYIIFLIPFAWNFVSEMVTCV